MNTSLTMHSGARAPGAALLAALLRELHGTTRASAAQPLPRGATAWVRRPLGRTVRCEAGTLWLTFDHEAEDVILEAGQVHACEKSGRLALHALEAARYSIG